MSSINTNTRGKQLNHTSTLAPICRICSICISLHHRRQFIDDEFKNLYQQRNVGPPLWVWEKQTSQISETITIINHSFGSLEIINLLLADLERVQIPSSRLKISSPLTTISWRRLSFVFRPCWRSLHKATALWTERLQCYFKWKLCNFFKHNADEIGNPHLTLPSYWP